MSIEEVARASKPLRTVRPLADQVRRELSKVEDYDPTFQSIAVYDVENWLRSYGVRYSAPFLLPMADIDVKKSRANQARLEPLVPESVTRYAQAFLSGAQFPPIVVYPSGFKFVIIDGNNRQEAAKEAGLDKIRAVAIAEDTPGELIQLLTVAANTTHGVTPDLAWRFRQAEHLIALGYAYEKAAQACGLAKNALEAHVQASKASDRARRLRLPNSFHTLGVHARRSLGALSDDAVFYQTSALAISLTLPGTEITKLTRELRKLTSEKDRLSFIGQIAEERKMERRITQALGRSPKPRGRISASAKQSLASSLGKILKVDAADLVRSVVTEAEKKEISLRLEEAAEKLLDLQTALDQAR